MFRKAILALCMPLAACVTAPVPHRPFVLQSGHMRMDIGPDGNTVILDAPAGLVVFDTGRHLAHAQAILDFARASGKPVAAVVNSHWHLDHTTGNRDLLAAYPGALLVATGAAAGALTGFLAPSFAQARALSADPQKSAEERARAARTLAALEDRAALAPANPITHDGPVTLGGRRFDLHVARAAATEADLWLVAPDEDLTVVGDLVVAPVPFFDTGCEGGWRRALDAIAAARWSTLVPGHGAPMDRAGFTRWRRAFDNWVDCAHGTAPAAQCAQGWMDDAREFYTDAEAADVRALARGYVSQVLRSPPDQRMAYCRAG